MGLRGPKSSTSYISLSPYYLSKQLRAEDIWTFKRSHNVSCRVVCIVVQSLKSVRFLHRLINSYNSPHVFSCFSVLSCRSLKVWLVIVNSLVLEHSRSEPRRLITLSFVHIPPTLNLFHSPLTLLHTERFVYDRALLRCIWSTVCFFPKKKQSSYSIAWHIVFLKNYTGKTRRQSLPPGRCGFARRRRGSIANRRSSVLQPWRERRTTKTWML